MVEAIAEPLVFVTSQDGNFVAVGQRISRGRMLVVLPEVHAGKPLLLHVVGEAVHSVPVAPGRRFLLVVAGG